MSEDRKPSDDLREGLSLIFRAAKSAAKQIDVAKIDKTLDKAFTQVTRVVSTVGRAVGEEVNRMANSPPPWARDKPADDAAKPEDEQGSVHASTAPEDKAEEASGNKPPK
jgi:hypothetical protein